MQKSHTSVFAGIDIGTSHTKCVIGTVDADQHTLPTIVGVGKAQNLGMRKGSVIHIDEVAESIAAAVNEAERTSGQRVTAATISVNGSHLQGMNSKGIIAISSTPREVVEEDRGRVEEAATVVKLPPNRDILQVFARNYRLDGQDNIKNPVGMSGVRLEIDAHIVTASAPALRNIEHSFERSQIEIHHRIVSGLAAAEAVLERRQKESGCVVLDIGAGTTSIVVFEEAEVQHIAVLPIGGQHITNDLAIGLRTDIDIADEVKLKFARAMFPDEEDDKEIEVRVKGKTHTFKQQEIDEVVEARLDELFQLIDKELKKIQKSRKLPGGVYITGGTAGLKGIDVFARDALELPARVARITHKAVIDEVSAPEYASAVGLMLLDYQLPNEYYEKSSAANWKATSGRVKGFLRKFKS